MQRIRLVYRAHWSGSSGTLSCALVASRARRINIRANYATTSKPIAHKSISQTALPKNSNPSHALNKIIKPALSELLESFTDSKIKNPTHQQLNALPLQLKNKLSNSLRNILELNIDKFVAGSSSTNTIPALKIEHFLNPQVDDIAPILYTLQHSPPPAEFGKALGVSTRNELLHLVLEKLLFKEYLKYNLTAVDSLPVKMDFSNPAEWYPEARKMKRKIIMHVGPTNSGKTYNALKLLQSAKSGYYAGPLRLLAREIYEKYREQGINCNLVTGEEIIPDIDEFGNVAGISSGTIEMVPVNRKMDICVIDEIQMIGDNRRGEAWTNAVLGVQAKELHLCGEVSAVPLIEKLSKITGDSVEVKSYNRLGELVVEDKPVNRFSFKDLRRGDCVVAFSKLKILLLKREIESKLKLKAGVVYGALPPEVRSEEAGKFNSGKYDILIASDAIGMGLNLKIRRVVFVTVDKFDGKEMTKLTASQVKQIAGRAGRFSSEGKLVGYVTAFGQNTLEYVRDSMDMPLIPLKKAYLWPTGEIWARYIAKFPKKTPLVEVFKQLEKDLQRDKGKMDLYQVTELDSRKRILKQFEHRKLVGKIPYEDQLRLSIAPLNLDKPTEYINDRIYQLLFAIANMRSHDILYYKINDQNIMKKEPSGAMTYEHAMATVGRLEEMHKMTILFLWLSQRWPTLFVDKEAAMDCKTLLEKRITEELANLKKIKIFKKGSRYTQRGFGDT